MHTKDTELINHIVTLVNTGKANTIILKNKVTDLLIEQKPALKDVNFDKGIEWPEGMCSITHMQDITFQKSITFHNRNVKLYSIGFEAVCRLQGWERASAVARYKIAFTARCSISLAGSHVAFREITDAPVISEIEEEFLPD